MPEYAYVRKLVEGKANQTGKFLARLYQMLESALSDRCHEYALTLTVVVTREHDGMRLVKNAAWPVNIEEEFAKQCAIALPGIRMPWKQKEVDYTIRVPMRQ